MAQIKLDRVVLDECINRDTTVGYYHGGVYVIGTSGEFKSKMQQEMEDEEKKEEERAVLKTQSLTKRLTRLPNLTGNKGNKNVDEKNESNNRDGATDESVELPDINKTQRQANSDEVNIKVNKSSAKGV